MPKRLGRPIPHDNRRRAPGVASALSSGRSRMEDADAGGLVVEALVDAAAALPEYASPGCAGADLRASEPVVLAPGARAAVPTGVRLQIPPGHVGLVWPRSGLAVRH